MKERWTKANTILVKEGNSLTEEKDISNRWTNYCFDLYNYQTNGDPRVVDSPDSTEEDDFPTLREEVESAVKSLKNRKATGIDNIPAELMKFGEEIVIDVLTKNCNNIWQTAAGSAWPRCREPTGDARAQQGESLDPPGTGGRGRSAPEEPPRLGSALDSAPVRRGRPGASRARSAHHVRPAAGGAAQPRGRARQRRAVIQNEKVCSSEKATELKHKREPHGKHYLELRKKFGLFKEERVYLNRIPFGTPPAGSEASVCSRNNFKKNNDSWSALPQETAIIAKQQDHGEEEKIIVDLEQDLTKKRKAKLSPMPENGKRTKMVVKSAINPSVENNSTSSVILNKRISSTPVLSQQKNSTGSIRSSLGRNSEQDPCVQDNQVQDTCCSDLVSSEDDVSTSESSFRDDAFLLTPPDLDETIRDEKIKRLKRLLTERAAALEEMRKKMQQT
ncbi:ligand-dependent nuclear receptor-interacting factor 1 [Malaclemys terrapin pileata]|uniref:ligand-dependent nuclear receptor-interacting factor 1 n=1 Tax=Malaclemys terrapin pileata TaxID=2991368 RepID=UPI0023A8D46A|nr:ligand-dependent nuclear receptor-interacting factor 1 [Malaclemys terrapin pileata]